MFNNCLKQLLVSLFYTYISLFAGLHIKEEDYSDKVEDYPKFSSKSTTQTHILHHIKEVFHDHISQLGENLKKIPIIFDRSNELYNSPRHKKITFILPISGRYSTFIRFLKVYEEVCIRNMENSRLITVLYRSRTEPLDYDKSLHLLANLKNKYVKSDISIIEMPGHFSRAPALQQGTDLCSDEDLMFFVDVDIVFNSDALLRIRLNTIRHRQLYFPIVYSQYDPKIVYSAEYNENGQESKPMNEFAINEKNGIWRQFGFGIASVYKSDFLKLRGFNTNITGWGFEDVEFYHNVIKSKTKFMRTPDPGLIHIYHPVQCDENLNKTQKEMCLGTKISMFGSLYNLEQYVKKHPEILEKARNNIHNGPG